MLSWNIVSDWIELYIYIIFNISSVLKVNRIALKKCCDNLNLAIIKIIIAILVSILGQLFITRATRVPFFLSWSSSQLARFHRESSLRSDETRRRRKRDTSFHTGNLRFASGESDSIAYLTFTPTKENEIEREGKKENKENIRIIERIITLNRQSLPRDCIPR